MRMLAEGGSFGLPMALPYRSLSHCKPPLTLPVLKRPPNSYVTP